MIAENSYLIPDYRKNTYATQNQYLLVVNDLEKIDEEAVDDPLFDQLHILEKTLKKQISEIKKSQADN